MRLQPLVPKSEDALDPIRSVGDAPAEIPAEEVQIDSTLEAFPIRELPSNFLPYQKKELVIRGLTVGEIKATSRLQGSFQYSIVAKLIGPSIQGADVMQMPPADFKALLLYISFITDASHTITLQGVCPYCSALNLVEQQFPDLEFSELEDLKVELKMPEGEPWIFRYIQVADMIFLESKALEEANEADVPFLALAASGMPHPPKEESLEDVKAFWANVDRLKKLPARTYYKPLDKLERRVLPDIHPVSVGACRSCMNPFRIQPEIYPSALFSTS